MSIHQPEIGAKQLTDYMAATVNGRRRIIAAAMEPPRPEIVGRHKRARGALTRFLLTGATQIERLAEYAARLRTKEATSPWKRQVLDHSAEAIERFLDSFGMLELGDRTIEPKRGAGILVVEGVRVRVTPNVIVRRQVGSKQMIGAIKLRLGKSVPLSKDAGLTLAHLVRTYLESRITDPDMAVDRKMCQAFDVFSSERFVAPKATQKRQQLIEEHCREIMLLWNGISQERPAPEPYDIPPSDWAT